MPIYTITTDAFSVDIDDADDIDSAVAEAFEDEQPRIKRLADIERVFTRIADGAWCRVEKDGETVEEFGPYV